MQSLDLTISRGPGKGKSVRLPAERAFSIGRGQSNDLTLSDRLVSSHPARIQAEGGYYVLTDLNSKNHTYVNGNAITGAVTDCHARAFAMCSTSAARRPESPGRMARPAFTSSVSIS